MNAILSILVCFAMLFSGGAALPAQPETATTRTLRNLTIAVDGESVPLAVGVIRDVTSTTYNDGVTQQVAEVRARKGFDSLRSMILAGETWEVK